jgi:tetratricopeptide (TPR) repeat protein
MEASMRFGFRLLPIVGFWLATVLICSAQTVSAKTEFDLGVSAYKQAKYEEAIGHFRQAVLLDPTFVSAHLHLASAYAQQYIPGVDAPENNQIGQQAIVQFEQVLGIDPTRDQQVSALKGIAYLYLNMKQFERAKQYDRKILEIEPDDPETYFAIAVIDWTESYQFRMEQRAKLNLKLEEPLIDAWECWDVEAKNEERVKDGIEMLTKAISIRQTYDDAMAYMNLMYRERADIQCGNTQAYHSDIRTADQWVDVTIATKKANAASSCAQQIEQPDVAGLVF